MVGVQKRRFKTPNSKIKKKTEKGQKKWDRFI
jgi:hypothetical protein